MKNTDQLIYTISELTRNIRVLLENNFPNIWVEGEISNFLFHSSGHMYFTLKDVEAQIKCVFFSEDNKNLSFELKDGMQIICFGKIGVYDKRGQYQLYVKKSEPKGLGVLQIAFEKLKEKLAKEGLFEEAHKKQIPVFPNRIGVITSKTGAVIRDIIKVAKRRNKNVEIFVYPVLVQGEFAKKEISAALADLNRWMNVDVIIIARGGGSMEDLWAFNEEEVARAIYESRIPVISAVGHEIDYTIADFVADRRAPTPSAAAEIAVPEREELLNNINNSQSMMFGSVMHRIASLKTLYHSLATHYILQEPINFVRRSKQNLDELSKELHIFIKSVVEHKNHSFTYVVGRMEAVSPVSVLLRGYSITTTDSGKILKDISCLKKDDIVKTRLHKGTFTSIVQKTED